VKQRAVFFDRDGTINPDPGYINKPEDFNLFPGVPAALKKLKKAGFVLILITNQSGLGRKLILPRNLCLIHDKMQRQLFNEGVAFDGIYVCPHTPKDNCSCRKPLPELALRAIEDFSIDPKRSFLLGDKVSDMEMAAAAGIPAIFIGMEAPQGVQLVFRADGVPQAVEWILSTG
jgi:histidinol-phosphate phosphatase family protein